MWTLIAISHIQLYEIMFHVLVITGKSNFGNIANFVGLSSAYLEYQIITEVKLMETLKYNHKDA